MKHLFLLFTIIVLSYSSYSQAPPKLPQGLGAKGTRVMVRDQMSWDSAAIMPKDTIKLLPADTGAICVKNSVLYKWVRYNGQYVWRSVELNNTDYCNIVNVGADATGSVDASSYIQNLINSGCKVIYAPTGTYLLDNKEANTNIFQNILASY